MSDIKLMSFKSSIDFRDLKLSYRHFTFDRNIIKKYLTPEIIAIFKLINVHAFTTIYCLKNKR